MRHPLLCLPLLLACAGCTHHLKYRALPAPPAPAGPQEVKSTLTAVSFGTASISGSVDGDAFSPAALSGQANSPVRISDSRSGKEFDRACGEQRRQSVAQADASFTPQDVPGQRRFGFTLAAKAFGRGGFFRSWIGIDTPLGHIGACSGSNDRTGSATAVASGRMDILFSGTDATAADRLVVQTSGSGQAEVTLSDTQSAQVIPPLPETNIGARVFSLPKPGPYVLTAAVKSSASATGACCESFDEKTVSVSVFSLRDALSVAGASPSGGFAVRLPVFVGLPYLEELARKELLDKDGRYFPCRGRSKNGEAPTADPKCSEWARDVYLENFRIAVRGGGISLDAHLSGHVNWWRFRPGVTGDINFVASPQLDNRHLVLQDVKMDAETRNELVHAASEIFAQEIDKFVRDIANTRLDIGSLLDAAIEKYSKNFPIKAAPVCLGVKPSSAKVLALLPREDPQGFEVLLGIELVTVDPKECVAAPLKT